MAEKKIVTKPTEEAVAEKPIEEGKPKKSYDPNVRYWRKPSKRAKEYAEERKSAVHIKGNKEGQPLSEYEKGVRSGYLQCQSDHAGAFIYKTVAEETEGSRYDKKEAAKKASRDKGFWKKRKAKKGGDK